MPSCWFISWVSVLGITVAEAFESVGSERIYSFAQRKSAVVVVKIKRNEIRKRWISGSIKIAFYSSSFNGNQ